VFDPSSCGLSSEAQAQLFRIAQEAVSNAVRHGRAARIDISLSCADGNGLLIIDDDGIGLPRGPRRSGGIGLHTMEYRARMIGASLTVRRRPLGGTRVTCAYRLSTAPITSEKPERARKKK